jgi:hypothetical protein
MLIERVMPGQEHRYKRTVAVRKMLDALPFHGYLYPSIATQMFGLNFCLPTAIVDAGFRPVGAHVYELSSGVDAWEVFRARPVATSADIATDGTITWMHASTSKVPPKSRWWHLEGGTGGE